MTVFWCPWKAPSRAAVNRFDIPGDGQSPGSTGRKQPRRTGRHICTASPLPAPITHGMVSHMLDPFSPDSYIVRAATHIIGIEPRVTR